MYTDGASTLTTYYFMGGAYEKRTGTTTTTIKYYSFGGQTIMNDGTGLKYFLTDHLGSVVAITNASGGLVSQQRYLPFGQVRTDIGTISQTDLGYTGQRNLDAQNTQYTLGLLDYRARFYSSYITHFNQPDTIVPDPYNPQSLNRYSYALNNPINNTDPSGHATCTDDGYCGKLSDYAYQKHIYTDAISGFDWNLIGIWTLDELKTIYQAGADISNAVGGTDNMIELFGNVDFEKKSMDHPAEGLAHHIWLNSNPDGPKWGTWSIAHELAHGWDASHGNAYSIKLESDTGGYTDPTSFREYYNEWAYYTCKGNTLPGCNDARYFYGGVPPKGSDANFNRKEDFSESFAAYVYPNQALNYIQSHFPKNNRFAYTDFRTTFRGTWMGQLINSSFER